MGRLPSRPRVHMQPDVGVPACSLLTVRKCCGVVQKEPGWLTP